MNSKSLRKVEIPHAPLSIDQINKILAQQELRPPDDPTGGRGSGRTPSIAQQELRPPDDPTGGRGSGRTPSTAQQELRPPDDPTGGRGSSRTPSIAQQELRPPDDPTGGRGSSRTPSTAQQELRPPNGLRKHPAHGILISNHRPTIVFLTVCCDKRQPWLAYDGPHNLLLDIWQDTSHWVVGRYVLMPDHVHLFAAPQSTALPLESWVRYWKSQFTKRNKNPRCRWQTDHWDTRMRSEKHYEEKSEYMFENPIRAGLVDDRNHWKYQGVLHELRWN